MTYRRLSKDTKRFLWISLLPSGLIYSLFVLWPAFNALLFSFTRWDGLSKPVWIGVENFVNLFNNGSDFLSAIGHNIYLTVIPGVIILTLALFFAWMIHLKVIGATLFRVTFFFPNVIASVAIALLWVLLYSTTDMGPINNLRQLFHLEKVPFLESSRLLQSIIPMMVWSATGFYLVLFLAAMENIPTDYYEAAHIDGASPTRQFVKITLPLMWDVLTTGIIFLIVGGLKFFDAIWVMENGRPSPSTHTMSSLMYAKVFEEYNVGYGTAIAVLLFVFVLLVTRITIRILKRESLEY